MALKKKSQLVANLHANVQATSIDAPIATKTPVGQATVMESKTKVKPDPITAVLTLEVVKRHKIRAFVGGDLHLKSVDSLGVIQSNGVNSRLQDKLDALSWIVQRAIAADASHLILLGDAYHAINPPETLRKHFWTSLKPAIELGMRIVILIGNHDTTGHISNFMGEAGLIPSNVHIVGDTMCLVEPIDIEGTIHNFVYVPFAKHDQTQTMLDAVLYKVPHPTAMFGHFEIANAELAPDNAIIREGFAKEQISSMADVIWLGHIHKHQIFRPGFAYIGSMVKCDFGEVKNKKVYGELTLSLDASKTPVIECDYVEIPQRPMYQVNIDEQDADNIYVSETIPAHLRQSGILLKFIISGSDSWVRTIDKQKLKKRFPLATRILFETKKEDTDRVSTEVVTSNLEDRVHAYVKEKAKEGVFLTKGLAIAKEVQQAEL